MKVANFLVAGTLGLFAAALVYAHDEAEGPGEHHPMMHAMMKASVEHAAMHNILVTELAQKTGRSETDIAKLFQDSHPREVAEQLGIDKDTMHALIEQAHATLIDRALAANLITADQAQKLHAEPMPMMHKTAAHKRPE